MNCNTNHVENEKHFSMECNNFKDKRSTFMELNTLSKPANTRNSRKKPNKTQGITEWENTMFKLALCWKGFVCNE